MPRIQRLHVGGALLLGCFGALAILSRRAPGVNVWGLLSLLLAAWAILLWTWLRPGDLAAPSGLAGLWLFAVLFRLLGLAAHPVLEDDWYRYLWDGRVFAVGGNPYAKPPAAYFHDATVPDPFQRILDRINHPDVATIYGPVCQYAFALAYWVAPGALWPWKLLLIVADLLTLKLLLRLTAPRHALLYAWCPLLIQETAFTAHPDSLAILFLVGACHAFRQGNSCRTAVACALAAGTKVFALPFAPFLLARSGWRPWLVFGLVWTGLYAPFWAQGSAADWSALTTFLSEWEFNSTVFAAVAAGLGRSPAKVICAAAFGLIWLGYLVRWSFASHLARSLPRGDCLYGAFFLLSAVVNPWYLLWLLPFVALFPSACGIAALAGVSLSYLTGSNLGSEALGTYEHPGWVRPLELALILAAGWWDWRRRSLAANRHRDVD